MKLENEMALLLLEVLGGRKNIPEKTLSNLVRSLGVIKDSLSVLQSVSEQ